MKTTIIITITLALLAPVRAEDFRDLQRRQEQAQAEQDRRLRDMEDRQAKAERQARDRQTEQEQREWTERNRRKWAEQNR